MANTRKPNGPNEPNEPNAQAQRRTMEASDSGSAVKPTSVSGQKSSPHGLHAFVLVTSAAWQ